MVSGMLWCGSDVLVAIQYFENKYAVKPDFVASKLPIKDCPVEWIESKVCQPGHIIVGKQGFDPDDKNTFS